MSAHGVLVDEGEREILRHEIEQKVAHHLQRCQEFAGADYNPGSAKQTQELLFGKLGVKAKKFSKITGEASADAEALLRAIISTGNQGLMDILEYRTYAKLLSTYVTGLPVGIDGRVHTTWKLHGTATGRLASRRPNLQNIPQPSRPKMLRTGLNMRNIFVAPPGYLLVACDASQIELRLAAIFAGCKNLLFAYGRGEDVHRLNAAIIYDKNPADVTKDERQTGKKFSYMAIYQASAAAIQKAFLVEEQLLLPIAMVKQWISRFNAANPEIPRFVADLNRRVKAGEQSALVAGKYTLRNPYGRLRRLQAHPDRLFNVIANHPQQSTVADYMLEAMLRVDARKEAGEIILQVHDEIVMEVPADYAEDAARLLKEEMEKPIIIDGKLHVIPAESKIGRPWGKMQKLT